MNVRIQREGSPEGRVAAAARVTMMRIVDRHNRLPDYADLREGIREALKRELLIAELAGLAEASPAERERRRDEILRELAPKQPEV